MVELSVDVDVSIDGLLPCMYCGNVFNTEFERRQHEKNCDAKYVGSVELR